MSWEKILEVLYGFIDALLGAIAGAGCVIARLASPCGNGGRGG